MSRHEKRIIEAFKSNNIKRILLVDDAYDSPELDESSMAELTDFLEKDEGREACSACDIAEENVNVAYKAVQQSESDNQQLREVYLKLYDRYVITQNDKFDPGGRFKLLKHTVLYDLQPLIDLLCRCGDDVQVETAGFSNGKTIYDDFQPHVLFIDYLDDGQFSAGGASSDATATAARQASQQLLRQVISSTDQAEIPSIVLMSSHEVDDVDEYRHQTEKQILSLRFNFLNKQMVRKDGDSFSIHHDAADALLNTSQGYVFAKYLQQALHEWKVGAQFGLASFMDHISDLHMKDFAYLLRFRLRDDSQTLSHYMEWLFGEYLKDLIEKGVNWSHISFSSLDSDEKTEEKIEGAFEGPSTKIAEIFHGVRVNSHRVATPHGYQLGDLYARADGIGIRVVITPDCDLVVRKNGRMKAESILTMGGRLNPFDQEDSAVDDFLLVDGTKYSVSWNPKDLQTFSTETSLDPLREVAGLQFIGTLRPLYAQDIQRRALTDLSRVGLPVAPALGLNATATVWIRKNNSSNQCSHFEQIEINSPNVATVIPSRAGYRYGHRVLLRRSFVNELIDKLIEADANQMCPTDASRLRDVLKEDAAILYERLLVQGGLTNREPYGIRFTFGSEPERRSESWLQIVLAISEETMEEPRTTDPLDVSSGVDG